MTENIGDILEKTQQEIKAHCITAAEKCMQDSDRNYCIVSEKVVNTFKAIRASTSTEITVQGFDDKSLNDELIKPFKEAGYTVNPVVRFKDDVFKLTVQEGSMISLASIFMGIASIKFFHDLPYCVYMLFKVVNGVLGICTGFLSVVCLIVVVAGIYNYLYPPKEEVNKFTISWRMGK